MFSSITPNCNSENLARYDARFLAALNESAEHKLLIRSMASSIDSSRERTNPNERRGRCLRIIAEPLDASDDPIFLFKVDCPRRGRVGLDQCMECSNSGRLLFDTESMLAALICELPRDFKAEPRLRLIAR